MTDKRCSFYADAEQEIFQDYSNILFAFLLRYSFSLLPAILLLQEWRLQTHGHSLNRKRLFLVHGVVDDEQQQSQLHFRIFQQKLIRCDPERWISVIGSAVAAVTAAVDVVDWYTFFL